MFFCSSRRRHTRWPRDWSSDVCSSDLTTPFDMVMLNDLDRYLLVMDVIDRVPGLGARYAGLRQRMSDARLGARRYTREHGVDIPEVADWQWPDVGETGTAAGGPEYDTGGDNE